MTQPLWRPEGNRIRNSKMTAFAHHLENQYGLHFSDYTALHKWSIDNLEQFWQTYLTYSHIKTSGAYQKVLNQKKMPGTEWFEGLSLNFAENLLRNHTGKAITSIVEGSEPKEITFDDLKKLVARCARSLRETGVMPGDRVAGYVANVPEAIIASLACAALGATWGSASPDFGLTALADRFRQVSPKIVFASTHYQYGGKLFRTDRVMQKIRNEVPGIEQIVSIPYPVADPHIEGDLDWNQFLGPDNDPTLEFDALPFNHPLYILFSSGTTGAPKCMVHAAGGTLLQHKKELQLHCNITAASRLLYFTTCGWMMWNWQLSALSLGANICLYDGSPGYPDLTTLWRVVDELGITHFGTSGRFIETCMKSQPPLRPREFANFRKLESILYTGSSLSQKGFRWIYQNVKKDVHLGGISGGTDIISCFVLGNPNLPVYAGEIQCKGLGVDVVAFDEGGEPTSGQPGELVCRQPIPSMPVEFLNDPGGHKYYQAYFNTYPGVWRHGDYVEFTERGGIIVHGRSDASLNPGGVRIGSAEIYAALEDIHEIAGAVVTGWVPAGQNDEVIVLFVVMQSKKILVAEIEEKIRKTVREKMSPRHVPRHIFAISGIPVTRSGKTVELSVKAILAGKPVPNRNALANQEVLLEIETIRQKLLKLEIS